MALFRSVYDAIDSAIAFFKLPLGGAPIALAARVNIGNDGNVILGPDPSGTLVPVFTAQDNLTAFAGGGQVTGTKITASQVAFTAVGSAGDSALLPPAIAGMEITVINTTATSMNVFPAVGEIINALSANAALAVGANKQCIFYATSNAKWRASTTGF